MNKLIIVSEETKKKLDKIKIHPRQSYNEIIDELTTKQEDLLLAKDNE